MMKRVLLATTVCVLLLISNVHACRFFGMTRVDTSDPAIDQSKNIYSQSMTSLKNLGNAQNPHGWGVYRFSSTQQEYIISRGNGMALVDSAFPDDASDVEGQNTVIAHVRYATSYPTGDDRKNDPHPFVYDLYGDKVAFAHRGGLDGNYMLKVNQILGDYKRLDIFNREYSGNTINNTNDSELYGMMLIKNYIIAKNYSMSTRWAIYKTMKQLDDYISPQTGEKSKNFIFTDSDTLYAMQKNGYTSDYKMEYEEAHNYVRVGSSDVFDCENLENERLLVASGGYCERAGSRDYSDITSNLENPALLLVDDKKGNGDSRDVAVANNEKDGSFAVVWRNGSGVWMRWYNQMGLAEHEPLLIDSTGIFQDDLDVTFGKYNSTTGYYDIYLSMIRTAYNLNGEAYSRIYVVKCWYDQNEIKWKSNYNRYSVVPNQNSKIVKNNIRIASNQLGNIVIVWEEAGKCYAKNMINNIWNSNNRIICPIMMYLDDKVYNPDVEYLKNDIDGNPIYGLTYLMGGHNSVGCVCLQMWNPVLNNMSDAKKHSIGNYRRDMTYPSISSSYKTGATKYVTIAYSDYTGTKNIPIYVKTYKNNYNSGMDINIVHEKSYEKTIACGSIIDKLNPKVSGIHSKYWKLVYTKPGFYDIINKLQIDDITVHETMIAMGDNIGKAVVSTGEYVIGKYPSREIVLWDQKNGSSPWEVVGKTNLPLFPTEVAKRGFGESENADKLPETCKFNAPYPNPFNGQTTISYELPEQSNVTFHVYNVNGQLVKTLNEGGQRAGQHSLTLDASSWATGVYFVKMEAGSFKQMRKVILMK